MASGKSASEPIHINLDGKSKLFHFPEGKYPITHPGQLKTQGLTPIEASVPRNGEFDLSRKGEFPTPIGVVGRRVELHFRGVDCLATHWLNGEKWVETLDTLIDLHFDVTGKLDSTEPNTVTFRLGSVIIQAAGKHYDPA